MLDLVLAALVVLVALTIIVSAGLLRRIESVERRISALEASLERPRKEPITKPLPRFRPDSKDWRTVD